MLYFRLYYVINIEFSIAVKCAPFWILIEFVKSLVALLKSSAFSAMPI